MSETLDLNISSIIAVLNRKKGTREHTKATASAETQKAQARAAANAAVHRALARDEFEDYSPRAGWRMVAHVALVQHQHCRCCGDSVSSIAGEFTEHVNVRLRARAMISRLHHLDEFSLPTRVEEAHVDIAQCAACLRLSRTADDLLVALESPDSITQQQELFQ